MAAGENRPKRLITWNELNLERPGGRNCSPLYPGLQPYGRIGVNNQVGDLPGRSRPRPMISVRHFDIRRSRTCTSVEQDGARNMVHGLESVSIARDPAPA